MLEISDPIDSHLLDDWQRDFPIVPHPFAEIGRTLNLTEDEVIARLERMKSHARITRVGATCAPNTVSASTLAAMAAPEKRIDEVAEIIGSEPGVNHSYLREHHWNMWFVATGPDTDHVERALARISEESGLRVLDLRLVRPFNVDLGFRMCTGGKPVAIPPARPVNLDALEPGDRAILQGLTDGMPLVPNPYSGLGRKIGRSEDEVLARIAALQRAGIISRLGVIVRHRALGWRANAMVVWNLTPEQIDVAGPRLAVHPGVTLCYERRPVPGVWPYRLYSMIHARSRVEAEAVLDSAMALPELAGAAHEVLFSTQCFKQRGAMIAARPENAV